MLKLNNKKLYTENNENKVEETTTLSVNNSGADIYSTKQISPKTTQRIQIIINYYRRKIH